jgi:hypothetical protein
MMSNPLSIDQNFNALSLKDLLEARDLYHTHLLHKQNVIATAIGRYLIRKSDPWPAPADKPAKKSLKKSQQAADKPAVRGRRTLDNSEVRPYSWPCILVFVDHWVDRDKFGHARNQLDSEEIVPKTLYLPDGRTVPVCIVEAPKQEVVDSHASQALFPDHLIGGGFPLVLQVQQQQHIASVGGLVTDGHLVYALTNRHVTGAPGEPVYSIIGGELVKIGKSSAKQLTRMPFEEVYNLWPGKHVFVNLDIGLIEIDDKNAWTAQIFGIGQMGPLADLSVNNLSLKLIGAKVRAFGAATGQMKGAIHALFYRYKSVAGSEYVSDFLIGPRDEKPFKTNPGDSGTLWMLDFEEETTNPKSQLMPIAVQWGGHVFLDQTGSSQRSYALATCLSTVCNLLEVDVIRDWNIGQTEYWGEMGHYTVGAKACEILSEPGLRRLMEANHDRVGFPDDVLGDPSRYQIHQAHYTFVPLADVADNVWRNSRPSDSNNHFADLDEPGGPGEYEGRTLLQLCQNPNNISVEVWSRFYDDLGETRPGALPFRVWQFYNEMVKFLSAGNRPDIARFVCAAGCLAHYIGDACQPLHISRLHHNFPGMSGSVPAKVHSVFETTMLNGHAAEIVAGLNRRLRRTRVRPSFAGQGGKGAAIRVIQLMRETVQRIPPEAICNAYNQEHSPAARSNRLWNDFGEATMDSLVEGIKCLGDIWESAWQEGGGNQIAQSRLRAISTDTLSRIYRDRNFVVSLSLSHMGDILT